MKLKTNESIHSNLRTLFFPYLYASSLVSIISMNFNLYFHPSITETGFLIIISKICFISRKIGLLVEMFSSRTFLSSINMFSLYMTTSYINSRDINHDVIYICSVFRNQFWPHTQT